MLAKEVRRPGQAGLQIAAVVDIAGQRRREQAVGAVALARGVSAQRAADIGGRAAGGGQGRGLVEAGVAGGQAGAACQGLGDQLVELGVAQACPPLAGAKSGFVGGGAASLVIQTQVSGSELGQRRMGRALGGTASQGQGQSHGGRLEGQG